MPRPLNRPFPVRSLIAGSKGGFAVFQGSPALRATLARAGRTPQVFPWLEALPGAERTERRHRHRDRWLVLCENLGRGSSRLRLLDFQLRRWVIGFGPPDFFVVGVAVRLVVI